MTATWKVAPCLAFGNTAVLKMSELSPLTAARLGELALEAGIPARRAEPRARLRQGRGRAAGAPPRRARDLVHRLDGHRQPHRAGAGLKKFSMELGGKSPFVVFDDADLDRALDAALFMIFSNNGERCTAGSPHPGAASRSTTISRAVRRARDRHHGRRPAGREDDRRPDDLPAASRQGARLHRARPQEGATLLCGGLDAPELPARVRKGNFVLPTVFADVDNRMRSRRTRSSARSPA